jgi:hypothetical protein
MDANALADMLARDHAEWRALTAILDGRPDSSMHNAVDPAWNARDVYAHLARWINHSTDDLEGTLAGKGVPRPTGTDDEINARWQAEDAALSLPEARDLAQRAYDRRLAAINAIPPDRWNQILDAIAHADGWEHIAAHRRYIESASSA